MGEADQCCFCVLLVSVALNSQLSLSSQERCLFLVDV